MRRFTILLTIIAVVLLGITAFAAHPRVIAQEATPAGEDTEEGLTFEPVSFALGVEVQSPSDLFIARIGMDPGAGFPIEESDPTTGILLVESGAFTVVVEGAMTVTRGAGLTDVIAAAEASGDFSEASEAVPAGETVTLEAGDAAYIPASVNGEIRNDGDERAVGLAFLVIPPEGMMGEGTPAP